jgi:hypothetical protein
VCPQCRANRRGVFFCETHREHLDGIFFPFLDGIDARTLLCQREKLEALCKSPLGALCGDAHRVRRRAVRNQIARIDDRLQQQVGGSEEIRAPPLAPTPATERDGAAAATAAGRTMPSVDVPHSRRGCGWRCRTCGRYLQPEVGDVDGVDDVGVGGRVVDGVGLGGHGGGGDDSAFGELCTGRCSWERRETGYAKLG